MDLQITKWQDKSFSGEDIHLLCEKKVRVIKYNDLKPYKRLQDAWGPHKAMIVLYMTKESFGHWCAIFEVSPGVVEFFDPYGTFLDDPLDYINPEFKQKSGQLPWLTNLIMKSPYDLIWNAERLQRFKKDVNTCGRWCGMRIVMRDVPLKEFQRLFKGQHETGDWLVTALTMFV